MKSLSSTGLQRLLLLGSFACGISITPTISSAQQLSQIIQSGPVISCTQLLAQSIPIHSIGLPTTGAQVISAILKPATGTGLTDFGEYCEAIIKIYPIDNQGPDPAPDIQAILRMPTAWNRKSMMFGGGAFNGTYLVVDTVLASLPSQPSPLARGYAVFASDSGHQLKPPFLAREATFALNDEALNNFASDALKKTFDAAMVVLSTYYGSAPTKSYFHGGSNGGREALMVAKKWPGNFDGLIVPFPAMSFTGLQLQGGRIARALSEPGAYLSFGKRRLVRDFGIQICDGLDGVNDGIISNVNACKELIASPTGAAMIAGLRCPNGADTGDTCLSDIQLQMLETVQQPIRYQFPLPGGERDYPGLMVWGSDWGVDPLDPKLASLQTVGLNFAAPSYPVGANQPFFAVFWDQWMRFVVARDPALDTLLINPRKLGQWTNRVKVVSSLIDSAFDDLSEFHAKGGKVLMLQGLSDLTVTSTSTDRLYTRLTQSMGTHVVNEFVRYYTIPGYGHANSSIFNAGWDSVSALENWVEHGQVPVNQVVTDKSSPLSRTRPLCEFPTWPRYLGYGDVNLASSFECVNTAQQESVASQEGLESNDADPDE